MRTNDQVIADTVRCADGWRARTIHWLTSGTAEVFECPIADVSEHGLAACSSAGDAQISSRVDASLTAPAAALADKARPGRGGPRCRLASFVSV